MADDSTPDAPPPEDLRRVTLLLDAVHAGEEGASERLLPLVYEDLRRLAAARMARLGPGARVRLAR